MKKLEEYINEQQINEAQKIPADQMYETLVKYFEDGGNVQLVLEGFLTKCFEEAPHKDFHIAVGDAVNNIYDEYVK